ncbi:MAG: hypothetical protein EOP07_05430 [Proteobacteria bacterium]|nr:MAG: hypothetical protein EOP07_05430 [Pseudomonadota bacterium]
MTPTSNVKILRSIHEALKSYSCPNNLDGFYPHFCGWVLREWEARPYYLTELANFGHDLTQHPYRTDFLLREKAKTYRDFINANNGRHYATSLPDQGTACEPMEKNLYEFFHESMRLHALTHIEESFLELDADDFWNRIFCEDFEDRAEVLAAEEIASQFGFYGYAADPYLAPLVLPKEENHYPFQNWELRDFQAALDLLKIRNQGTRLKIIQTSSQRRDSLAERMDRKYFKTIQRDNFRA